jgi:hypothetical protein
VQVPEVPVGIGGWPATAGAGSGAPEAAFGDGLGLTDISQGVLVLRSALGRRCSSLESAAEVILAMLAPQREDGVTVLLARMPAIGGHGAPGAIPL